MRFMKLNIIVNMLPEYCVSYAGQIFIFTEDTPGYRQSIMSELKIGRRVQQCFEDVAPGSVGMSMDTAKYDTRSAYIIGLRVFPIWIDSDIGQTSSFTCQLIAQELANSQSLQSIECTGDLNDNNLISHFNYDCHIDVFESLFEFKPGEIYQVYINVTCDAAIYNLEMVRVILYLNGSCGNYEAGSGSTDDSQDDSIKKKCAPCTIN